MTANRPKSLVSKLAEALNAVGGVEKKGKNEHYHYSFVRAGDITKEVRHELFSRGIILTKTERGITEREVMTNSGATMTKLRLEVEFTLRDADSDVTISSIAYGDAMDTGDKAIYKAKTGALKYYLRDLGLIPDEKDDPESDSTVDDLTDAHLAEKPNGRQKPRPGSKVMEARQRAFQCACDKSGKTMQQRAVYLRDRFSANYVTELTSEEFEDSMKWAVGSDEGLVDGLETSINAARKKAAGIAAAERCAEVAQGD